MGKGSLPALGIYICRTDIIIKQKIPKQEREGKHGEFLSFQFQNISITLQLCERSVLLQSSYPKFKGEIMVCENSVCTLICSTSTRYGMEGEGYSSGGDRGGEWATKVLPLVLKGERHLELVWKRVGAL